MACLIDDYRVEVGVGMEPCRVIRAGEGGRVFGEGRVLWELSACVQRGKEGTHSAHVLVLIPILILVIFPHITAAFCTITTHVTTTAICQVIHITVGHHGGGRGGGDFSGVGRRHG